MKRILVLTIMAFLAVSVFSQNVEGTWKGKLVVPGGELRVHFNITKTDNGYSGTLDSPDQNAYGLPLTSVELKDNTLTIKKDDLAMEYVGTVESKDKIKGTFTQMGQSFEMDLLKKEEE